MELFDEDDIKKGQEGKKTVKRLLIIFTILLIIIGIIIVLIPKKTEIKTTLSLNGKQKQIPKGLFYTSENGETYISIKDFADLAGFEYYRGEYNNKYIEDTNKCYVLNSNEATSLILGSNMIYKSSINDEKKYEYYTIEKPIIIINNKLYASMDTVHIAFNSLINYNKEQRVYNIFTLSYLYDSYKNNWKGYTLSTTETIIENREEKQVQREQSYNNKKSLAYGLAIVNKNQKFGVLSLSGDTIIGTKYDSIDFVEERQEFIVTSKGKQGVLSKNGNIQIDLNYDSIKLLDGQANYYLVSQNSKFGILKSGEEIVVPIEFGKIYYEIVNNKKIYYLQSNGNILTLEDYLTQT